MPNSDNVYLPPYMDKMAVLGALYSEFQKVEWICHTVVCKILDF